MDRNKKIIITLSILTVIFTILGGTLAYWRWQTSEEQKTNVVFTLESDFSCAADGGGNIESGDVLIVPTEVTEENRAYYIKREVTVTPTINVADKTIYMDLWLDINSIGTGLSNSDYFMYSFTTTDTSPYQDVVVSGNFKGKKQGDKIELFTENEYSSSTPVVFYLWIWLDAAEESSATMNQSFNLLLNGSCTDVGPTGAKMLIANANPSTLMYTEATSDQKAEMWTFLQPETEQVASTTDYRYIGNTPKNYITFNDEVWRIIGVFDGRIKIIKDESIGMMSWDYKQAEVGSSTSNYGSNDWTDSQLMYMLNSNGYTLKSNYSMSDNKIYDGNGNLIYQLGCKPTSISGGASSYNCTNNTWNLNNMALSQLSNATFYLGSLTKFENSAQSYYTFERGGYIYSGREANWIGLVGLMYPSDYAYTFANGVDDICYTNTYNCETANGANPNSSWLFKNSYTWSITPYYLDSYTVHIDINGLISNNRVSNSSGIFPVAYLKSDVRLQGTGASDDPYVIID